MKKLLLPALLLTVLSSTALRVAPGTLTPDERKYAIDYFEKTKARLLQDVKGLSEEQLNWKADSSRWSVYQCTEHIALAETMLWHYVQNQNQGPATPEKRAQVKVTPDQLVAMLTDRSHKFHAPADLVPAKQFEDEQAALAAFVSRRDSTIDYIRTTQDELKDHFIMAPFGTADCYEGLIFLAAHCARHTLQIEEVMATPGFPKQ
ncbi:MAG TPA: DinB family protein [Puia sp.]|nr:DinB family protein [Puia sp.]